MNYVQMNVDSWTPSRVPIRSESVLNVDLEPVMAYYEFVWTDETVAHLAEHGVAPEEFEYVVSNPESRDKSRRTGRPCCFGETSDGRYLYCVYEMLDDDTVIPVTGYEVPRPRR
jgi:hypothetical protein